MNNKEILDILGIEEENRKEKYVSGLIKDFKKLVSLGYEPENIWLKSDAGIYVHGCEAMELGELVAYI